MSPLWGTGRRAVPSCGSDVNRRPRGMWGVLATRMVRVQPGVRSGRARLLCDDCFRVYFIDVGMLCDGISIDYRTRFDMITGKTHCYAVQGRLLDWPVRREVDVFGCLSCGGDHPGMVFKRVRYDDRYPYRGKCPTSKQTIRMRDPDDDRT